MSKWLTWSSIRTRLLVSYIGVFTVGVAVLTLVAGNQVSSAARSDYEQRLINEVQLVAQAIKPQVVHFNNGELTEAELQAHLDDYSLQINGTVSLIHSPDDGPPDGNPSDGTSRDSFRNFPELESASHGETTVVEREEDGVRVLATAASLFENKSQVGRGQQSSYVLVQLTVPIANLQSIVLQRWLVLGAVFVGLLIMASVVSLRLARTITNPLDALRHSAVQLSQGDLSHRVDYAKDDEVGQVARAFNEMADEVQSMLEEQRAFASNTSHELRTPLTTIRLRSEALRLDTTLDDETARQYIEEIDDEVIRLGHLVQDLTLLSRFDAGRAEFGHDEINLVRLAGSINQQVTHNAEEKSVTLDIAMPEDPLILFASLNHLLVVFRNVLDNAIKYTPSGGHITWVMNAVDGGILSTIKDTGQGIHADALPHVFERFYRADKAHSRTIPGTGLGLALVKSIVDAYGGRITIQSDGLASGTIVEIFWPTGQSDPISNSGCEN